MTPSGYKGLPTASYRFYNSYPHLMFYGFYVWDSIISLPFASLPFPFVHIQGKKSFYKSQYSMAVHERKVFEKTHT